MYCIFLKGKTFLNEIKDAEKKFEFYYKIEKSITDKYGKILLIKNIKKK